jgi:hypothetical protein
MDLAEPVKYIGIEAANIDYHHGQLRPAIGVQSYQVLRANRTHQEMAEGYGWTYNHAPMLAYWRGRFYLEYLSDPVSESVPPGQTLLTTSEDGRNWGKPRVVFPEYLIPDGIYRSAGKYELPKGSYSVMHQRMGFYVVPNDRLLALGFYGVCPHSTDLPNDGRGIGRVVREVYGDGSCGPICFIRYNRHAGWSEANTRYPFFRESKDQGFVEACEALLANRLMTLQWWEEDRSPDGFYAVEGHKALSYYHLPDGRAVGLWKWAKAAVTADEGVTWSPVAEVPTLIMAGGKVWGQRTSDGHYALVYNPSTRNSHRWPLAMVTSDDGLTIDHLLLVNGEVPPRRFVGLYKDYGLQYVRGIVEGNGAPPDGDMWITYSMNKEDIWVSRIPVPIRHNVDDPVSDVFDDMVPGGEVVDWNIYSPRWAPISVVDLPGQGGRRLELRDADPYDYAKAERVFPEGARAVVSTRILARHPQRGQLYIEVVDGRGQAAARVLFDADGHIRARNASEFGPVHEYGPDAWYDVSLTLDAHTHRYDLSITGMPPLEGLRFDAPVNTVERVVFRTGAERRLPMPETDPRSGEDLPGADEPVKEAIWYVKHLTIR